MHYTAMRTHSEIVSKAGPDKLATLRKVSLHTARSWAQRDSIPAEHWQALVMAGHATLEELAAAAATRTRPTDTAAAA